MSPRWSVRVGACALLLAVTACATSAQPPARPNEVQVVEPAGQPDSWTYAPAQIAVAKGTTEDIVLTSLNTGADIMRMEDNATSVQAYLSGQSQFLAANSVVVVELAKKNPGKEFDFKFALRRAPAHITVRMGEHNLLRWLDTFIFQTTLTGDLDKLHVKWLGGPMSAPLPPL